MKHLVIGQHQKAPNFSTFHWSPHGCLITIGQHFVTTLHRVVHLSKRTETSLITESDQSRANHQLLQLCTVRTAWSDSDQAVRAVHSCTSWFIIIFPSTWYICDFFLFHIEIEEKYGWITPSQIIGGGGEGPAPTPSPLPTPMPLGVV